MMDARMPFVFLYTSQKMEIKKIKHPFKLGTATSIKDGLKGDLGIK